MNQSSFEHFCLSALNSTRAAPRQKKRIVVLSILHLILFSRSFVNEFAYGLFKAAGLPAEQVLHVVQRRPILPSLMGPAPTRSILEFNSRRRTH